LLQEQNKVATDHKLPLMSDLGQKRTYALQQAMSALHPIATSIAFFGMSALGQKRTLRQLRAMSALGQKQTSV
jgi:hypothetical protein